MQPLFCGMHAELFGDPINGLLDCSAHVKGVSFTEATNRVGCTFSASPEASGFEGFIDPLCSGLACRKAEIRTIIAQPLDQTDLWFIQQSAEIISFSVSCGGRRLYLLFFLALSDFSTTRRSDPSSNHGYQV